MKPVAEDIDELVIIKTIDSDWIIGKLEYYDRKKIMLTEALGVDYRITDSIVPIVYFYKYCLYNESYGVEFRIDHLMNYFRDVSPYIVKQYRIALLKYEKYDTDDIDPKSMDEMTKNIFGLETRANNVIDLVSFFDEDPDPNKKH